MTRTCSWMLLAGAALCGPVAVSAHPWDDGTLSPDRRADLVIQAATPEELQDLLHGPMLAFLPPAKRPAGAAIGADYVPGIPRLGIPPLIASDASLGVANNLNARKGDVATALPAGIALAASFDPEVARAGGAMAGQEARAKGFNVLLGGGVNLTRDPRGGRDFEYLGEDPLLAGRMVAAQIDGVQSAGILSTIKHFALNAQETGRTALSVQMGEAAMRESDLLAFRIGIEGGKPGAVMCSYNRVNAVYACENGFLLNHVLRGDWSYPGYVLSDWGAVHSTEALLQGLDQQSGEQIDTKRFFGAELTAKLASGAVPAAAVRTAAHRILRTIFAHGLTDPTISTQPIDYPAHAAIAQHQAEEGIVLLRNEGGLLPLAGAKRVVVIGGHADVGVLSGGGSSQVRPVGGPALEIRAKGAVTAAFAARTYDPSPPLAALKAALPGADIRFLDGSDPAAAAAAARAADVAIVFAEKWSTEGEDAKDLSLEPGEDALIDAVAAANPRTVVVLETGNPVLMPWLGKVGAVVEAWYPGQRGGEAIASVLTGRVNPSGRLPITFPAAVAQLPNPVLPGADAPPPDKSLRATYGIMATTAPFDVHYPEGSDVGYRWYAGTGKVPLFPFGYGLSYTRFTYSGLRTSTTGGGLRATVTVTNAGTRPGVDTPQFYVRGRRARRLAGWARVALNPGESRTVTIAAEPRVIADYDEGSARYVVAPGAYTAEIGESAADPKLSAAVRLRRLVLKP